jgi:hypothetical protein
MSKFKFGDRVKFKDGGEQVFIIQRCNANDRHLLKTDGGVYKPGRTWSAESDLIKITNSCPVCGFNMESDEKRVPMHFAYQEVCYGSFMPV